MSHADGIYPHLYATMPLQLVQTVLPQSFPSELVTECQQMLPSPLVLMPTLSIGHCHHPCFTDRFNHLYKFKEAEPGLETKQFFPNAPSRSLPLPTAFSATPSQKELSCLRNPTSLILLVLFIGSLLHFLQETGHFPE